MSLKRYGKNVLIAGGSEGIGSAYAHAFAKAGMNLFLLGRRIEQLIAIQKELKSNYNVEVKIIQADLGDSHSLQLVLSEIGEIEIDVLVYNAALSYIGKFETADAELHQRIADVNMNSSLKFIHHFGSKMVERKRGAVIIMSSLSAKQGSAYIATYAATKAFNLILAEGLWYEWGKYNVDVIACIAGATATPNFINSKPGKLGFFEPQVQPPEAVVAECLNKLGKKPSLITGSGNRLAAFFMNNIFTRKLAVTIMGNSTKKLYKHLGFE